LFLELFGNITRTRARDFNPSLGEESTGREHERDVDSGMDRIKDSFLHGMRGRDVVGNTRLGDKLWGIIHRLE